MYRSEVVGSFIIPAATSSSFFSGSGPESDEKKWHSGVGQRCRHTHTQARSMEREEERRLFSAHRNTHKTHTSPVVVYWFVPSMHNILHVSAGRFRLSFFLSFCPPSLETWSEKRKLVDRRVSTCLIGLGEQTHTHTTWQSNYSVTSVETGIVWPGDPLRILSVPKFGKSMSINQRSI